MFHIDKYTKIRRRFTEISDIKKIVKGDEHLKAGVLVPHIPQHS